MAWKTCFKGSSVKELKNFELRISGFFSHLDIGSYLHRVRNAVLPHGPWPLVFPSGIERECPTRHSLGVGAGRACPHTRGSAGSPSRRRIPVPR